MVKSIVTVYTCTFLIVLNLRIQPVPGWLLDFLATFEVLLDICQRPVGKSKGYESNQIAKSWRFFLRIANLKLKFTVSGTNQKKGFLPVDNGGQRCWELPSEVYNWRPPLTLLTKFKFEQNGWKIVCLRPQCCRGKGNEGMNPKANQKLF